MIRHEVVLSVPAAKVWDVLCRLEDWPDWAPAIRGARALAPGGLVLGARFALRQPFQPETVWRVTALDPGNSFAWRTERNSGFEAGHAVVPEAKGARVTAWLRPTGAMRLAWPILRPILRRALMQEARGLATVLMR